jgi:hypothetical protein
MDVSNLLQEGRDAPRIAHLNLEECYALGIAQVRRLTCEQLETLRDILRESLKTKNQAAQPSSSAPHVLALAEIRQRIAGLPSDLPGEDQKSLIAIQELLNARFGQPILPEEKDDKKEESGGLFNVRFTLLKLDPSTASKLAIGGVGVGGLLLGFLAGSMRK